MRISGGALLAAVVSATISVVGCGDRVENEERDKLGGEAPGVPPGPLHRPGQPCLVCHDGHESGPAVFSFAGTVYAKQNDSTPMPDALVTLLDSESHEYRTAANCAGNFFIMKSDYEPVYPVFVKVTFGEANGQPFPGEKMTSPIYRAGSCANCHSDPPGPEAAGHVYAFPPEVATPSNTGACQQ